MMDEDLRGYASRAFKVMNKAVMVPMWRLGLGKPLNMLPGFLGRYMVLTHKGRKSAKVYHTPVNYTEIGGDLFCTAGFGAKSDWYLNILADPNVEVWLPDGWYAGLAEDISFDENRLAILRQVLVASGFAASLFAGIDVATMTNQEIGTLTADYRLVRVRRIAERTGDGGPGEYAWIWHITTLIMGILYLLERGRKRKNKK